MAKRKNETATPTEVVAAPPAVIDVRAAVPGIKDYPAQAELMVVTTPEECAAATDAIKDLKGLVSSVEAYFAPMKQTSRAAWMQVCDTEKRELEAVLKAIKTLRGRVEVYANEQEAKRLEAERIDRAKAEEAARKEREKLEAQAAKAEASGKVEKAESLREKAEEVYAAPPSVAAPAPIKGASSSLILNDEVEITVEDLPAFVAALVAQKSAMTMISVKDNVLKQWVKSNGITDFAGLKIRRYKRPSVR